jgi:hypothetical protein
MKKRIFFAAIILCLLAVVLIGCTSSGGKDNNKTDVYYTVTVNGGTGGGSFKKGATVVVTAQVPEGKLFDAWEIGGQVVSRSVDYIFTVEKDVTVTALFRDRINIFTVKTDSKSVTQGLVIKGLGEYDEGEEATVKAAQKDYLVFLGWKADGEMVSEDEEYTFTVTKDVEIVPVYETMSPFLTFEYDEDEDVYKVTGYSEIHFYSYTISVPGHYNDGEHGLKIVSAIKEYAFINKNNLTKVTIGEGVKVLERGAFYGNPDLTAVDLPASLETIGELCFYNNFELTSVTIPESLTEIGEKAFAGTTKLANFYVNTASHPVYKAIEGILYKKDGTLVRYPQGKTNGNVRLHSMVTAIGPYAFEKVTINELSFNPETAISEIGERAFSLSYIKKINVPASVTKIGAYAFSENNSLTDVIFTTDSRLAEVGPYAFYTCGNLTSCELPESVRTIRNNAFENCGNIGDDVLLRAGLETIGAEAFKNTNLKNIFIAETVTEICENAFQGLNYLSRVTIDSVTIIASLIDEDACGQLIKTAWNLRLTTQYTDELPDYITENFTYDGGDSFYHNYKKRNS